MPSILAADMGNLSGAALDSERAGADGLHIDVMDGHFVPNLSMGAGVVEALSRVTDIHMSVHLMITRPDRYADQFIKAGADTLLIHIESPCDVPGTLERIRDSGIRAGITLNPDTSITSIDKLLEANAVDEVLLMTVHPGFGGQDFINKVLSKMEDLRRLAPDLDISVDGGINIETAAQSAAHGANIFMAGSSLFSSPDMSSEIRKMRTAAAEAFRGCAA